MTSDHKSKWKCALCLCQQPKQQNENTPVRTDNHNVTLRRAMPSNLSGTSSRPTETIEMDVSFSSSDGFAVVSQEQSLESPSDFRVLVTEIRLLRQEILSMNNNIRDLKTVVSDLSSKLCECDKRIDNVCARVEDLESRIGTPCDGALADTVAQLKAELNDRDQEMLLNQIEFTGVPEQKGENPVSTTMVLAKKIGVSLAECDVVSALRVGRVIVATETEHSVRPRPLVLTLTRRAVRDQLLQAARVRRAATTEGTGMAGPPTRFFVNERLTRQNRYLFFKARELKSRFNWRFVWTKQGRIYVRENAGLDSLPCRIRTENDLIRVFGVSSV
ncbi:unnamed protein product [Diatraea saccharalis]|uniref:FP protein C-terminal domain-containing protein n=1 Tax=Diatraea saccharalis TaxID=40085 RepID=A0A9N9N1G3_9NEOP|nr:unnamed protein product [Diatraea saccharalis]